MKEPRVSAENFVPAGLAEHIPSPRAPPAALNATTLLQSDRTEVSGVPSMDTGPRVGVWSWQVTMLLDVAILSKPGDCEFSQEVQSRRRLIPRSTAKPLSPKFESG